QPGMTGQVKEEVLSRFGELGVRVSGGAVRFQPDLLRAREFISDPRPFRYLDVDGDWQNLSVPAAGLAFTWCQVPIVYRLDAVPSLVVTHADGEQQVFEKLELPAEESAELFQRSGRIRQIAVTISPDGLFTE
ncbi:MAG: hypothetical protein OEN51_11150, partial [Gammaproteobacteria bacterium]|nr:hypothetical protein [Gammaproteobacteria bacterium]